MKNCCIFCGGEISNYNFLTKYINQCDYIICADSGFSHADKMGITPNLIIGDFDSYLKELPKNIPIIKTIPEKDDTDTVMAIKQILNRDYDNCYIFGATGGRLDHTLANIFCLNLLLENNINGYLIDEKTNCFLIKNNSVKIPYLDGYYISIFPYGGVAKGVTLKNVKYSLNNYNLTNSYPIGISNEFIDNEEASIEVGNGEICVLLIKK